MLLLSLLSLWLLHTVAAASSTSNHVTTAADCKAPWILNSTKALCTRLTVVPLSYDMAKGICERDNSHLLMIKDEASKQFGKDLIHHKAIGLMNGLTDKEVEGKYVFEDGTELGNYHPWMPGQPRDVSGSNDCVYMNLQGLWQAVTCDMFGGSFICVKKVAEREPSPQSVPEPIPQPEPEPIPQSEPEPLPQSVPVPGDMTDSDPDHCSQGYKLYNEGQVCVKVVDGKKRSFDAARTFCQDEGGDLVKIQDKAFRNFVRDLMKRRSAYWIGVRTETEVQPYKFVDGSDLGQFQPWANRKPNHCVFMRRGKWINARCHRKRNFACQKDRVVTVEP